MSPATAPSLPGSGRIGLDLIGLAVPRTGMGMVAHHLARLLPGLAPDLTFVLFLPDRLDPPARGENVEIVPVPMGRFRGALHLAEQVALPYLAGRRRLDLLHTVAFASPPLYRGCRLVTMHDLAFRIHPETARGSYRAYWSWAYGPAARRCRAVIVPSESTRADVIRLLGRDPESVHVVPLGVEAGYTPAPPGRDPAAVMARLGLPARFVLHVGTLQPRKDLRTLLRTFARLRDEHADLKLVVCGGTGWGYPAPDALAAEYGLDESVVFTGFLGNELMPDLYRAARLLLFTSRYEGFGLPLLEAMSCGTPVVAASTSSVPEVVGDAALLAPPGDDAALAGAAGRVLGDGDLRLRMVERGLERARRFSWEASAARMLEVYRQVLSGARPAGGGAGEPTAGRRR
jgi:glycosyltransferase involved in cell wall biosynthesis